MSLNRTTNSHNINRPTERFQMMIFTITSTPLFQLFFPNLERIRNQYVLKNQQTQQFGNQKPDLKDKPKIAPKIKTSLVEQSCKTSNIKVLRGIFYNFCNFVILFLQ
jgi:hypothetical protein